MSNLDLIQCDGRERRLGELNQSICGRLNQDIGPVRNTSKADFSERNVDIHALIFASVCDLLRKSLELPIQCSPASSFLLLSLEFLLVSIAVFTPTVSSFIKLHFCGLTIKLDILRLSLANHDGRFEVHMDEDNQFMGTGLKEKMLDVAEKDINMLIAER